MELTLQHSFAAPISDVLAALASAQYAEHLAAHHSFFAEIRVLSLRHRGGVLEREVRYRARPFITRLGVFSLPESWFVWVEHSRFDLARGRLTFDNVPEVEGVRDKLVNRGAMQFSEQQGERGVRTLREARFDVAFALPSFYRSLAEVGLSLVGRQLVSSLDEEARLLAGYLVQASAEAAA